MCGAQIVDFLAIPVLFYIVVAIAHLDVPTLRRAGWLFDMGGTNEPWYHFYMYFGTQHFLELSSLFQPCRSLLPAHIWWHLFRPLDFRRTNYGALWATLPTQLAL